MTQKSFSIPGRFLLLLAFLITNHVSGAEANLILHHGKIVTADARFQIHEAMAVKDGRIVAIGSNSEVMKVQGPQTILVDLGGKMILPGLIDSHTHPVAACLTEFDHPIPAMETISDVLEYIRSRARALPEGDWIVVRQVFITRLLEQRYPTRLELDQAAPKHPVAYQTGPDASLNTLALHLSGIDRNFKVTDGGSGFAEKNPQTGEPTGILRNCSRFLKINATSKSPSREEKLQRLAQLFADYNSAGITGICDRDASPSEIDLYQYLANQNRLTLRVSLSQHIDAGGPPERIQASIREVSQSPLAKRQNPWLQIIGIKSYLDGGMLTGSAYMREPWGVSEIYGISDAHYRGVLFIPSDRLAMLVRAAAENNLQFTAHSVGDGSVHALLEAYREVNAEIPLRGIRPCISHSNFMSREAVELAAKLGVMVDIQPAWLYLDSRTLLKQFGPERLRYFQPLRSLFAAGVVAGGGSDHMQKIGSLRSINPYNPFLGMATAITRKAKYCPDPVHPEESLSREQAIRFYTINNARILFRDDLTGSLENGKLADFIVIDRDLLTCPAEDIAGTEVLRTYVDGKLLYQRQP